MGERRLLFSQCSKGRKYAGAVKHHQGRPVAFKRCGCQLQPLAVTNPKITLLCGAAVLNQCVTMCAGTFEFDFTTTKMPASDAKPLAKNLFQRVMSNLIVALRPSVNMHIKDILQMLRRYCYSSLQVTLVIIAP